MTLTIRDFKNENEGDIVVGVEYGGKRVYFGELASIPEDMDNWGVYRTKEVVASSDARREGANILCAFDTSAEEWKVRYSKDGQTDVIEWTTEEKARKYYNSLQNEKVLVTEWAELIYSPLDDDAEDEEIVVSDFSRNKVDIMGKSLILPREARK